MISRLRGDSLLTILSLVLLVAFAGCGSDDPASPDGGDNGGGDTTGNTISFRIDGVARTFDETVGGIVPMPGELTIAGGDPDSDDVIVINAVDAEGTFDLGGPENVGLALTIGNTAYLDDGSEGSIIVTNLTDDEVQGTFSGTLVNVIDPDDTIVVTDGAFTSSIVR